MGKVIDPEVSTYQLSRLMGSDQRMIQQVDLELPVRRNNFTTKCSEVLNMAWDLRLVRVPEVTESWINKNIIDPKKRKNQHKESTIKTWLNLWPEFTVLGITSELSRSISVRRNCVILFFCETSKKHYVLESHSFVTNQTHFKTLNSIRELSISKKCLSKP